MVQLVLWIAKSVAEVADRELHSEEAVQGQLLELELQHDLGEITDEQYEEAETALLERMKTIEQWQAEHAEEESDEEPTGWIL